MTDTTSRHRPDLSIDQVLALRTAAVNLEREFAEFYGTGTVERFLQSSYDQFAEQAHPLLAADRRTLRPSTPACVGEGGGTP